MARRTKAVAPKLWINGGKGRHSTLNKEAFEWLALGDAEFVAVYQRDGALRLRPIEDGEATGLIGFSRLKRRERGTDGKPHSGGFINLTGKLSWLTSVKVVGRWDEEAGELVFDLPQEESNASK